MRSRRLSVIAFLIGLVLILSGCVHVRQEVTLKANEEWSAKNLITFPKSTVDQIGEEGLTSSQSDFETTTEEAEAKGVKATMDVRTEDNGDVVFEITMEGKGLALLDEMLFDNAADISVLENGHYKLRYDAGDVTSITTMGGSYTFVLKGGKPYSHNATKVEGSTLIWENPTTAIEAEVGAGGASGGFPTWLLILLIVLGVVLLAALVLVLLYMRGQKMKGAAPVASVAPVAPVAPYVPPAAPVTPVEPVLPAEPPAAPSEPPPPTTPAQ